MSTNHLDRRDFSRMSLAALGGAMAGTTALAQQAAPVNPPKPIAPPKVIAPPNVTPPAKAPKTNPPPKDAAKPADPQDKAAADKAAADKAAADKAAAEKKKKNEKPKEIHLCRGLNSCQGKGKSGDNKCAGQGTCATTLNAPHECATGNACKGQGGCSETVGKNQCAGLGNGSVPLLDEEWPRLRKEFEARMARLKKKVGSQSRGRTSGQGTSHARRHGPARRCHGCEARPKCPAWREPARHAPGAEWNSARAEKHGRQQDANPPRSAHHASAQDRGRHSGHSRRVDRGRQKEDAEAGPEEVVSAAHPVRTTINCSVRTSGLRSWCSRALRRQQQDSKNDRHYDVAI
jgi:hypothetical protein